jgi:ATP-dependent DNA ligase
MLLEELDRTSTHVAGTRSRLANVQCLADCLSRVARATGPGSRAVRRELLDRLFGRATAYEQFFLVRLMTGELRQGALERIVVEAVARLPLDSAVLDGQVLALRPDGRPHPFQVTMSRFGSRLEVEAERGSVPPAPSFFDCLQLDGDDLIHSPASERAAALAARLPAELLVPGTVTDGRARAEQWLEEALARGHERVMTKALDAPYEAGRRGAGWLKVKRAHTLDLVVLAAEWGHGRTRGWLSNLHLGARVEGDRFVMLGKTFKGLSDRQGDPRGQDVRPANGISSDV